VSEPSTYYDEFADIELAELDDQDVDAAGLEYRASSAGPTPADPVAVPGPDTDRVEPPLDAQLAEAQATAAELRQHSENLTELDGAELHDHVAYYQRAHAELQRALGDIDNA
jgi:hypothetical protein